MPRVSRTPLNEGEGGFSGLKLRRCTYAQSAAKEEKSKHSVSQKYLARSFHFLLISCWVITCTVRCSSWHTTLLVKTVTTVCSVVAPNLFPAVFTSIRVLLYFYDYYCALWRFLSLSPFPSNLPYTVGTPLCSNTDCKKNCHLNFLMFCKYPSSTVLYYYNYYCAQWRFLPSLPSIFLSFLFQLPLSPPINHYASPFYRSWWCHLGSISSSISSESHQKFWHDIKQQLCWGPAKRYRKKKWSIFWHLKCRKQDFKQS